LSLNSSEQVCESFFLGLIVQDEFRVFLSSGKWFRTELRAFLSSAEGFRTKIPVRSVFLFYKMARNEIPSIFSANDSERNYGVLNVFLFYEVVGNGIPSLFTFHGMARNGIPSIFRSAKQTEFQRNESKFPSVPFSAE
jgi:hypothetical protein